VLTQGFVTAFSNFGHDKNAEPGGTWVFNAIDKEIDYSYRALHLTTNFARYKDRGNTSKADSHHLKALIFIFSTEFYRHQFIYR